MNIKQDNVCAEHLLWHGCPLQGPFPLTDSACSGCSVKIFGTLDPLSLSQNMTLHTSSTTKKESTLSQVQQIQR